MKISNLFGLGLIMASSMATAMSDTPTELDTKIVFTNSTLHPMQVAINGNGQYQQLSSEVPALTTRTLASIKRVDGANNQFNIQLTSNDDSISLSQSTSGTTLSFGASAEDLGINPQGNSAIQRHNTNFNNAPSTLAFNGSDLGDGGQLTYVLQTQDQKPALGEANDFNLLSYNIWATTIYGSKKVDTRLGEQVAAMAGYDALVLTEVFDQAPSDTLMANLRSEYPYQTADVFKAGKLMAAGTRIVSRYPIEVESNQFYDACDGIQCAASRAVIYARINKAGNPYHVFATHTQSSDDTPNREARLAQLEEMGNYIRSLNIPADEPVIMAGDFNVNKIGLPEDRDYMESILAGLEPTNVGHNRTYDSETNHWAEAPYIEYLDYTLVGTNNLQPTSAVQETVTPRSTSDAMWGLWDLSDHYGVRGLFTYPSDAQPVRSPFPYLGDVVHFQTHDGNYMRAMSGGNSFISAGSDQPGTWESFVLTDLGNGKVSISARDGHNVKLDSYLLGTLIANSHNTGAAESFEVVNLGNGKMALKADNGKYLRADFGGGAGLSAGSSSIGDNQTFKLIRP